MEDGDIIDHIGADDTSSVRVLSLFNEPTRVLVVGDVVLDRYVYGTVPHMAAGAPVPEFCETSSKFCLGGSANVANNLATMGVNVDLITVLGTDHDVIIQMLKEKGINTDGLIVLSRLQTKTITRYVVDNRTLFRADKVSNAELSDEIEERLKSTAGELINSYKYDMVVLCDYRNGAVTSNLTQSIISLAKLRGIPVLVDPKRGDYHKYRGATIIKPNEDDARILCGKDLTIPEDALRVCQEFTDPFEIDNCILTMSSRGMALYASKGNGNQPEFHIINSTKRVNKVDVTGAGDTATAALVFGYTHGLSLDASCRFAVACAEDVIQRHGTVTVSLIDVVYDRIITTKQQLDNLRKIIPRSRRVVLMTGCLDLLNAEHVRSLEQAKLHGDILIVALNSDKSARTAMGDNQPILSLEHRLGVLKGIDYIDFIVVFDEVVPTWIVERLNPDLSLALDDVNIENIRARFPKVTINPLPQE